MKYEDQCYEATTRNTSLRAGNAKKCFYKFVKLGFLIAGLSCFLIPPLNSQVDPGCEGMSCGDMNPFTGEPCITNMCTPPQECIASQCVSDCIPNCGGKTCGAPNGCGGPCLDGSCPTGELCGAVTPGQCDPPVSVPVELVAFEAVTTGETVMLHWETASELNNDYFQLERSFNGQEFVVLTLIGGHGTTSEPKEYQFRDETPRNGFNYYRLKQVNFDGSYSYSKTISTEVKSEAILVFPNPTKDFVRIILPHYQMVEVSVFNNFGQIIFRQEVQKVTQFNLADQPAGLYVLEIKSGNRIENFKFLKK
jgi:hypothetical protein